VYFVLAQSVQRPWHPPRADSRHAGDGGDGNGLSLRQRRILSVVQSADEELDQGDQPALRVPHVEELSLNTTVTCCLNCLL